MSETMSLLESLIIASEKAAKIARLCRQEDKLFELLIQEKSVFEANPRFVQDFKTLADVLIQETVKHDIGRKFPEITESIKGEESNVFSNALNETVRVEVQETVEDTASVLAKVLDGNTDVAMMLAAEVHADIDADEIDTPTPPNDELNLNYAALGVWIDPIDSTSEYINAKEEKDDSGIYTKGLRCVTVLIGVYDKNTGVPVMGVVNQPFFQSDESRWRGRCLWGITEPFIKKNASPVSEIGPTMTICLSSAEDDVIKNKLLGNNFSIVEAAGAGYKLLAVILGLADAYVLSKGTTFKWDTCGCQAILMSLGGDIVEFGGTQSSVTYRDVSPDEKKIEVCCNSSGIIATRNSKILTKLKEIIKGN